LHRISRFVENADMPAEPTRVTIHGLPHRVEPLRPVARVAEWREIGDEVARLCLRVGSWRRASREPGGAGIYRPEIERALRRAPSRNRSIPRPSP
jgi:hypothetical protein